MAVRYFPFNSIVVDGVPDRPANADDLASYLAGFFGNGVLMQEDTDLQVVASSGMNVQISAGTGNINGKIILNDAAEIVTLEQASASLDRIDRVVFRLDTANRLMEFGVLKGTPASNPVAPELTHGADVYELCLAEIRVPAGATSIAASYITDTRADAALCGITAIPPHMQDLEHGGTGVSVKTPEELLLAIGGAGIVKLWENASPSSSFSAQTIENVWNPDSENYQFVLCVFNKTTGNTRKYVEISTRGYYSEVTVTDNVDASSSSILHAQRRFCLRSNGALEFTAAYTKQGSTGLDVNTNLIPIAAYGIKGVN